MVLDASVILKGILLDERHSEKVLGYFQLHQSGVKEIIVPSLLYYEAANTLGRNKHRGVSPTELLDILVSLHFKEEILTGQDFIRCLLFMEHFNITAYDASYVVLSQRLKLPFITADVKLYQKIKNLPQVELLE